jgi:hypothetical protein
VQVLRSESVARSTVTLGTNETWQRSFDVSPSAPSNTGRVAVLLYRGSPPADPSIDNAYRDVHVSLRVTRNLTV